MAQGGELILTTGMNVGTTAAAQRAYVHRLAEAGVAGLGFGLGFSHDEHAAALVAAAEQAGLPLFEVPYPVPFIAITEAIFTRILAEQFDTLQRAVDAEHVLTRAVMEGRGRRGHRGLARGPSPAAGRCWWISTGCRSPRPRGPRRSAPTASGRS